MKVVINGKTYTVKVAKTEEEKKQGLLNIDNLPENEGMLFIYDEPLEVSMWMKDTKIPLDIIFIDDSQEVISVKLGEPMSENLLTEKDVSYVLELNKDSGVSAGDDVEFSLSLETADGNMHILAPDGSVQASLEGGERIFSRLNTKVLIRLAKKAYLSHEDKDYIKLGKTAFKYLKIQDSNTPEYVKLES